MAVLFSVVTASAGDDKTKFLVGGIPRDFDDLEGWTAFDDFMRDIRSEQEVNIHVEAYRYGEGITEDASPVEVAYFMQRMAANKTFPAGHCDHIGESDFSFVWSPEELFGMEVE